MKTTTETVRDTLLAEIDSLIKGASSVDRANAVAKLSAQVIYSSRLELENKRSEVDIGRLFGQVRWDKIDGIEIQIPSLVIKGGTK